MIRVIDYGMGNLRSVVKAVELYADDVAIVTSPEDVPDGAALILPGDGAFGMAMENLEARGWCPLIRNHIAANGFFLGICLGFQLLFESSVEFGEHRGLGVIPGKVVRFDTPGLKFRTWAGTVFIFAADMIL
jgi:glutamine amidotransferase